MWKPKADAYSIQKFSHPQFAKNAGKRRAMKRTLCKLEKRMRCILYTNFLSCMGKKIEMGRLWLVE